MDRDALITESDGPNSGPDIGATLPQSTTLPPGLTGQNLDVPAGRGPANGTKQAEPEYEIIETDSNFRPLSGAEQPGAQPRGDEAQPTDEDHQPRAGETPQVRREREDRAARRARQRQGRERTIAENARLQSEISELRQRLDGVEPRLNEFDVARLQGQIADVDRQIESQSQRAIAANRRMAEAMQNQDSEAFTAALEERDAARDVNRDLLQRKAMMTQSRAGDAAPLPRYQPEALSRQAAPPAPPPLSSQAREFVDQFTTDYPWITDQYNPDSQLVLRIDNAVRAEGYDPGTTEYWDEVESRMERHPQLRHRFAEEPGTRAPAQQQRQAPPQPQRQAPPERRGPMTAGASDRPAAPRANQVYLSPERKEAMISAGVLERDGRTVVDRKKFQGYLKQFSEYDRANGVAR